MKMDIKLEEGEMICPLCDGTGEDKHSIYICNKCNGEGKIDWVTNVVIKDKSLSILERIDVRKVIKSIKQMAWSEDFTNMDIFYKKMNNHLESLQVNKAIIDYNIASNFMNKYIDISITPVQSIEYITLSLTIN